MARPAPRLNLVVPCFNEEAVLPETGRQLMRLLQQLRDTGQVDEASGVVFVDDGSTDATWRLIGELHQQDGRVHGLKLSRNQGHQNALLAGLSTAPGDILISLDADLQDDLHAVPEMIDRYRSGADIVYGVRARRDTDDPFKRITARGYYALLRRLEIDVVPDHADFRLMSRAAITALADFHEVNLFLRGIIPMLGFRSATVHYDRQARTGGASSYSLAKMLALAADGIFSFSTVPLRWITVSGLLVSLVSMATAIWALGVRLLTDHAVPGWASTVIPLLFIGGIQLLSLGVIGSYVSRIYAETKRRPRFIVEQSL